jgi:hypothetical protein
MSPKAILILLTLLVLVSGCTSVSPVEKGNGMIIKEFSPTFTEIYPNEPVKFNLKIKNVGSVEAEGVFAEILGIDNDWYDSSFTDGGPWLHNEKLPDQAACRYNQEHGDLLPPNEQYGTEGESMTCTWTYRAPDIPTGTNTVYDVWARVFYTYSTITIKSITAGSQAEIRRYIDEGKEIPISTVSTTNSPIQLSITTLEPVRYWEDTTQVPIRIGINNVGGGTPCRRGQCEDREYFEESWGKVTVRVGLTEGMDLLDDCSEFLSGKDLLILPNEENSVVCTLELSDLGGQGFEQRMISLNAEYSYFTDAQTSIKIL